MNATKKITLAIAIIASGAAQVANANDLLSRNHYGDELDRCVAQIRSDIAADSDLTLQHKITEVSKDGAWYKFTIETANGTETLTSSCQANRFNSQTQVAIESTQNNSTRLASAH
jgi:hypothetical protein